MFFDIFKKKVIRNNGRNNSTVFCTLDGVIVIAKDKNFQEDISTVFLQAVKKLLQMKAKGCYIILTTSRLQEECKDILKFLKEKYNFEFDKCIFNLPSGKRILINDFTNEYRALSFNVRRNLGMTDLDISSF